jgi:hypothetical protein
VPQSGETNTVHGLSRGTSGKWFSSSGAKQEIPRTHDAAQARKRICETTTEYKVASASSAL